jgi:NAD(P)-dependent dehydrogenase (short-subunit alcohol dehydrogenase family)
MQAMHPVFPEFKDRVILLTGAANGIGFATAEALTLQGARMFVADRDAEGLQRLADSLSKKSLPAPECCELELADVDAVRSWVRSVGERVGEIHGLVNDAAIDPRIPFDTLEVGDWNQLFDVNVRSYAFAIQSALPYFAKSGAAVVNFASVTFHTAPPLLSTYIATKGAILALTRSLARELGPKRIRLNTVSPGWIMTDRQKELWATPEALENHRNRQCLPDLIDPVYVARMILFLASDDAAMCSSNNYMVEAGSI